MGGRGWVLVQVVVSCGENTDDSEEPHRMTNSTIWSLLGIASASNRGLPAYRLRVIGIDLDVVLIAVQLGALASFGLMARVAFLIVLKFLIKDDSPRVRWLLNWNKAALLYVVVSIVVNVPNLQT